MTKLELLDDNNERYLREIQRDDVPTCFVEDIDYTISISKYGNDNNLKGHCYAIKYNEHYVGIILIGEAIEDEADPSELRGKSYFRIIGFVIDKRYRGLGIGSISLKMAIQRIYDEYGNVPLLLECHKDNAKAISFYEKAGFRNTNTLHINDYYFVKK